MDWKAPGKFFSSLNIADRKMFHISFWSFLHHMKTCKKNFWKILIFCRVFCNVFESTTTFGKEGMATMIFVPRPCNYHYFTTTSQEKSTKSFIKISLLKDISIGSWDIQRFALWWVSFLLKFSLHGYKVYPWRLNLHEIETHQNAKCWISREVMKISWWNFLRTFPIIKV